LINTVGRIEKGIWESSGLTIDRNGQDGWSCSGILESNVDVSIGISSRNVYSVISSWINVENVAEGVEAPIVVPSVSVHAEVASVDLSSGWLHESKVHSGIGRSSDDTSTALELVSVGDDRSSREGVLVKNAGTVGDKDLKKVEVSSQDGKSNGMLSSSQLSR